LGDKAENEFIQKLHRDIAGSLQIQPAAVCYYIVSGGSVTMSIPCLELEKMEQYIRSEFDAHGIKKFMINHIDREQA
jgi:hypothetical protein